MLVPRNTIMDPNIVINNLSHKIWPGFSLIKRNFHAWQEIFLLVAVVAKMNLVFEKHMLRSVIQSFSFLFFSWLWFILTQMDTHMLGASSMGPYKYEKTPPLSKCIINYCTHPSPWSLPENNRCSLFCKPLPWIKPTPKENQSSWAKRLFIHALLRLWEPTFISRLSNRFQVKHDF